MKDEEDLKELPKNKKRMDGEGRKPRLPDVKTVLLTWIDKLRARHLRRITCNRIQRITTELRGVMVTEFIESGGWLQKFFH